MNHHAVLLIGVYDDALLHIPDVYRISGADTHFIEGDRFSIADARALRGQASSMPVASDKRCFIVSVNEIQREAQHALLKLFEDPPKTAQFFVILPHERGLLATLRSRFHIVPVLHIGKEDTTEIDSFLKASYKERMETITVRTKAKDSAWVDMILSGAEAHARKHATEDTDVLKDVLLLRQCIGARGASQKMLLEHLALTLPVSSA